MPPPRGWVQRFDQHLHRTNLLPRASRWLVACSGGADSVALLRLLHAVNQSDHWNWHLAVAHINHGIRGQASTDDETFVQHLADSLGLPCSITRLSLGPKTSEETARNARLRALSQMAARFNAAGALLAHHADDQAETVLMRIIRGCGIDGLSGMSETQTLKIPLTKNSTADLLLIRPLLQFTRAQLRECLTEMGQHWREDHTNATADYTRNRIRNEILPQLATFNPAVSESLVRLAAIARDAQSQITQDANDIATTALVRSGPNRITIQRARLRAASPIVRAQVLRYAISLLGGTSEAADYDRLTHALHIALTGQGGKSVQIGEGLTLTVAGQTAVLTKPSPRRPRD